MKKILFYIFAIIALPSAVIASTYTVPWTATSTSNGLIFPYWNGAYQSPVVPAITATSTTGTSTFAGAVGIGTTTPYGTLSITAPTSLGKAPAFIIASSTAIQADASTTFIVFPQGISSQNYPTIAIGTGTPALTKTGSLSANLIISAQPGSSGAYIRLVNSNTAGNANIIDGSADGAGNGITFNNFECLDTTTGGCVWRLFRNTNNSGNAQNAFEIYKGDGSASVNTHFASSNSTSYINALGGNVGIGTTTPTFPLTVNGVFGLTSTPNNGANIEVERTPGSNAFRNIIMTDATGNLYMTSPSGINTDLFLGINSTSASAFNTGIQLHFIGNNCSGCVDVYIATSSLGHVGIGTSSPGTSKLAIESASPIVSLNATDTTATGLPNYVIRGNTTDKTAWGYDMLNSKTYWTTGTFSAANAKMTMDGTGKIGIGTTTPVTVLDAVGSLQLEGNGSNILMDPYGAATDLVNIQMAGARASFGYDGVTTAITASAGRAITFKPNSTEAARFISNGYLGLGTTTPFAALSLQSTSTVVFAVATSTGANLYEIDNKGNQLSSGDTPVCGTGCSSVAGDNNGGQITTSALATAVTLTFSNGGFPSGGTMWCTVSDNSTSITFDVSSISNTAVTFSAASGLTGTLYYSCGEHISK